MEKSHIQKKLEENKFRRMLEALKGVAVRRIYYAEDPTADSWREIYLHYVKHEWQEMSDCLKISDSSTWEQICAALLEHHILFEGQTVLLVLSKGSGIMMAELLIRDAAQAAWSLWHHETFWWGGFYSYGFMLLEPQRSLLFDACSDSADEENYRVYTWDFRDWIQIGAGENGTDSNRKI